jgi:branched-chain amino acid transport system ATP-binding protein
MSNGNILKIDNIDVHYGELLAVKDISLTVDQGQIVSIIGANGGGKSTVLKAISGLMKISKGTIRFMGKDIAQHRPFQTVDMGISMVPEGRHIFPRMTVKENLLIGAYTPKARKSVKKACQKVYDLFPILEERSNQLGSNLSGGEQQMLAIGRSLMSEPKLILFDEISLGLAPLVIKNIYEKIREINKEGISIILVEQDIHQSLKTCSWAYILNEGRVALHGDPRNMSEDEVKDAYFGRKTGPPQGSTIFK